MSNLTNPIIRVPEQTYSPEDIIIYTDCGAFDNHKLKCKNCGKFMTYKGKTETFDSECDNYQCECGMSAEVSNSDSEHQVFWAE